MHRFSKFPNYWTSVHLRIELYCISSRICLIGKFDKSDIAVLLFDALVLKIGTFKKSAIAVLFFDDLVLKTGQFEKRCNAVIF
jgi:hypothetical protein